VGRVRSMLTGRDKAEILYKRNGQSTLRESVLEFGDIAPRILNLHTK
jgi:hypothetical protein